MSAARSCYQGATGSSTNKARSAFAAEGWNKGATRIGIEKASVTTLTPFHVHFRNVLEELVLSVMPTGEVRSAEVLGAIGCNGCEGCNRRLAAADSGSTRREGNVCSVRRGHSPVGAHVPTPRRVDSVSASIADVLAHAVHAGHTVHVVHVTARLSDEQIAKIDRIVSVVGKRATFATTRSAVLRRVIERGLAVVERELGLADSAPVGSSSERSTP